MPKPDFIKRGARAHLKVAISHLWLSVRHATYAVRVVLGHIVAALLAVVVVFLEWGWKPLAALLGQLARLSPIAWLEYKIRQLPPYGALAVFAVPSLLLLPLKLFSFYLIANGYKLAAASLFVGAKVVGTALVARIYLLTEAALVRIPWFKRAYDFIMPRKLALVAWVRESYVWRYGRVVKERVKDTVRPILKSIRIRLFRR